MSAFGVKRTPALCTQIAGAVQRCSQPKRDSSLGTFEHCTGFLVRQGDRIHERPLLGVKRTSAVALHMSAFGSEADIPSCTAHVRL